MPALRLVLTWKVRAVAEVGGGASVGTPINREVGAVSEKHYVSR